MTWTPRERRMLLSIIKQLEQPTMTEEVKPAEATSLWAIVELMGHVRLAGRLSEEERFGSKMGRLDIPNEEGEFVTQWFGGGSVYRITAVTEDVARRVAKGVHPEPVSPWDFPKQIAAHAVQDNEQDDETPY